MGEAGCSGGGFVSSAADELDHTAREATMIEHLPIEQTIPRDDPGNTNSAGGPYNDRGGPFGTEDQPGKEECEAEHVEVTDTK